MNKEEIRSILHVFFATIVHTPPQDEDDLFQNGILDSQGVLQLVFFLEEQFNITVDAMDVTLEKLGSIHEITQFVQSFK